jgi:predicted nucleic acid-binding protein
MKMIIEGKLGIVYASRDCLHELYYVSKEESISLDEYIARAAALTSIENLRFLETTYEIDLLALTLMRQYNIKSIFDAYYVAAALNQVSDHTATSTDDVYDMIPGLVRIDPRKL